MLRLVTCLLLATAAIAGTPVAAQEISQADRATLETRIAAFDTVMKQGRMGDTLDFIPPRLLDAIAKKFGVPASDFKASFSAQIAQMMKDVKFVSFGMDLSAGTAGLTPDKRRTYMLIPTETVVEAPGKGRFRSKTNTLAIREGGVWYLIRIDSPDQVVLLRETYPEFTAVEFPSGSMTPVE